MDSSEAGSPQGKRDKGKGNERKVATRQANKEHNERKSLHQSSPTQPEQQGKGKGKPASH